MRFVRNIGDYGILHTGRICPMFGGCFVFLVSWYFCGVSGPNRILFRSSESFMFSLFRVSSFEEDYPCFELRIMGFRVQR